MTEYQEVKSMLRSFSEWTKVHLRGDKPAIRQSINDYVDSITKEYSLSEDKQNLLHNYAAKLHP